jgi:hypothetical protein
MKDESSPSNQGYPVEIFGKCGADDTFGIWLTYWIQSYDLFNISKEFLVVFG